MRQRSNKPSVSRFQHATNTHDEELISRVVDQVFRPDVLIRTPLPTEASGAEAIKEVFVRLHRAFPDLRVEIQDLLEDGDRVVARNVVTGTQTGEYLGRPPTGRTVRYEEIFIVRFVDGLVAETWGVVDVLTQLRQLDLSPV
jgi:predicted ester cyclase